MHEIKLIDYNNILLELQFFTETGIVFKFQWYKLATDGKPQKSHHRMADRYKAAVILNKG